MKTKTILTSAIVALVVCFSSSRADAQWGGGFGYRPWGGGYGYYRLSPLNTLGKVKVNVDINYSGDITQTDAALGNGAKRNPYGLVIGTNEMTKFMLTCIPNQDRRPSMGEPTTKMDFHKLVCSLEIRGVNLGDRLGRFASFEEEVSQVGRILVWLDSSRRYLLLDSADPARRRIEWPYASSVPPQRVYVQALENTQPGAAFLVTLELDDSNKTGVCRAFGEPAIWDRVLVSAHTPGIPKPYEDRTPVWVFTGGGVGNTK
ncbi:MAG TPA: hypothetical protein VD994_02930 [Prosthecobacter sp.]|nr:hypothetical protein [Prosthecobacter sp.]